MLVFEIKDDKEHILGKKSKKEKKMILGLDDQGLNLYSKTSCIAFLNSL